MWTAVFSFLKGKVFTEAGSLVIPLLIILSVFVTWNSESILTKFGFETTSNLKSKVTLLETEVERLKEANKKLSSDLRLSEEKCGISVDSVTELCAIKEETKTTVDSVIDERKKESERIKRELRVKQDDAVVAEPLALVGKYAVREPASKEVVSPVSSTRLSTTEVVASTSASKVDRLSLNNIRAINSAYDQLFKEN